TLVPRSIPISSITPRLSGLHCVLRVRVRSALRRELSSFSCLLQVTTVKCSNQSSASDPQVAQEEVQEQQVEEVQAEEVAGCTRPKLRHQKTGAASRRPQRACTCQARMRLE